MARQGQWRDALAAFERSSELHPHPVTTYNIGYVERALGHFTRARKFMQLALVQSSGAETLPEDLAALARGYLVEIEPKLARVAVTIEAVDVALTIDGRPLEVTQSAPQQRPLLVAGTASPGPAERPPAMAFDLLIDPGTHVILVSIPGKQDTAVTCAFDRGSSTTLQLPEPAKPASPPSTAQPRRVQQRSEAAPSSDETNLAPVMWTAFGIGAAGIVTGSVFGVLALDKQSTLEDACSSPTDCPKSSQGDIDHLNTYALVADIAFIVGAVGAGTGGVLWFLDRGQSKEQVTTLTVQGGPRSGAVSVTGRF